MSIAHYTLTLCKHHHHFLIAENEKKIVDLHLWMVIGSRFHPQIGHWLVKGSCEFYCSVSQKNNFQELASVLE